MENKLEMRLKELSELKKDGKITTDEYELLKVNILRETIDVNTTKNNHNLNQKDLRYKMNLKSFYKNKWFLLFLFLIIISITTLILKNKYSSSKMNKDYSNILIDLKEDMVYVEGGSFWMGAQAQDENGLNYDPEEFDESPVHQVTLNNFFIGKHEVTQALWTAIMETNPSQFKGKNLPVEHISWDEIQEFIKKLNLVSGLTFRLPTEAEWEFAARGGNKIKGYKYSGSNVIEEVAWYSQNSPNKTQVVGTKLPNELGIFDMSGNVFEWCYDSYNAYSFSPQINPKVVTNRTERVLRGGGWSGNSMFCRVSSRFFDYSDHKTYSYGFRLVLAP